MVNSAPAKVILFLGLPVAAFVVLFLLTREKKDAAPAPEIERSPPVAVTPPRSPAADLPAAPQPPPRDKTPATSPATPANPRFYDFPTRDNPPGYDIGDPDKDTRFTRTGDGHVIVNPALPHSKALHNPEYTAEDDLENLDSILNLYRWAYRQYPVGDNEDVIAQLTGRNPMKIVVIPPDHPAISPDGQLLDRFGNPYFFHAISESKMDVWSFGPDGIIGTQDDVRLHGDDFYNDIEAATE